MSDTTLETCVYSAQVRRERGYF